MFCIYLRTNSDLCHLQHKLIGFYNRDEKCLQRGTDWVFKYSGLCLVFKGLKEIDCKVYNRQSECTDKDNLSYSVFSFMAGLCAVERTTFLLYNQRRRRPLSGALSGNERKLSVDKEVANDSTKIT